MKFMCNKIRELQLVFSFQNFPISILDLTIVMPVHNQEEKIVQNVKAVLDSLTVKCHLIIIDDKSSDKTLIELVNFFSRVDLPLEASISLYTSQKSLFETQCDALGIELATTKFVLEIQADMEILDPGFDRRLISAMNAHPDLIAISGRGTEPLEPILTNFRNTAGSDVARGKTIPRHVINTLLQRLLRLKNRWKPISLPQNQIPKKIDVVNLLFPGLNEFSKSGLAGRVGMLIEVPLEKQDITRTVWVGQTVMRGPLIIDRQKYMELKGFNLDAFFLGYDEHDLFLRAYRAYGYRVGFAPVIFESPLDLGTTRKARTILKEMELIKNFSHIRKGRRLSPLFTLPLNPAALPPNEIRTY